MYVNSKNNVTEYDCANVQRLKYYKDTFFAPKKKKKIQKGKKNCITQKKKDKYLQESDLKHACDPLVWRDLTG